MIDIAAHVGVAADQLRDAYSVELFDRRAALAPLAGGVRGGTQRRITVAGLDPAVLTGVALDAVTSHQAEDEIRGASHDLGQARPTLRTEDRLDLARIELQPGDHLTAVATGRAGADLARLQHHDGGAPFGEVQRRREPGESSADDAHVRPVLALERSRHQCRCCGRRPEASG